MIALLNGPHGSPTGATNQLRHDAAGYLVEAVDSLGHAISYVRDGAGNLLETTDALGLLLRCTYDARGLRLSAEMPNGALTRFEHDAQGNLVRLIEPNGRAKAIEVDDIGRIIGVTDEEGYRTAYHYDAMGVLQSITLPNGAVTSVEHDADGHIAAYHTPDDATWRMHWAGHHMVYRLDKPNGESSHYRYDREEQLVQIANERGEIHTLNRDVAGRVVAETFFDGRRCDYKLDAAGQLAAHRNGAARALPELLAAHRQPPGALGSARDIGRATRLRQRGGYGSHDQLYPAATQLPRAPQAVSMRRS
ncbi:MAG TPA: hypothetical protein VL242_19980 [Sorangium sp.]|nr:hypothetical protein [Sorangium sp.]